MTVPGAGPLVATVMIAAVADGSAFRRGRDFAAWLGLFTDEDCYNFFVAAGHETN